MHLFQLILPALLATPISAKRYDKPKDAVLLSNVRSLTLTNGKLTTGRRSDPIPQLTCVGGSGKGLYDVDVMRCKNSGAEYDAEDIQWTCQASLPPEFKLGSTEVVCEGYDNPDDPYVLKGSCGVDYRLVLTELGEEKYGKGNGRWKTKPDEGLGTKFGQSESWSKGLVDGLFRVVFWFVFIAVLCIILYRIFNPGGRIALPNNRGGFFGGGGGGGGWPGNGDDDPPPPYSPRAPPRSKPTSSSSRSNNSGPGFWSGAGLGGAAGYAAGNYMASRNQRARQQNMFGAGPSNYGGGGSPWFGGGGPSSYGGGGGASPAPSSSRHESTGFGGTRRR